MSDTRARAAGPGAANALDVQRIRGQFPILARRVHGKPLIYLDSAATTQKPQEVLDAVQHFCQTDYANVHRGLYELSVRATEIYEAARQKVTGFIGAGSSREIVFVRGTTEAINLVAQSFGRPRLEPGDEILISHMEHHSNIVPWQMLCEQTGARLRVAPINDDGELIVERYEELLSPRTKLVALVQLSNALGTVNPVRQLTELAHAHGARVLLDGAQAVARMPVDVRQLDCDFYAFSGHKMYGPTGIGALYGKAELLEAMPPYQGGGEMIRSVSFDGTTYNDIPHRFEAGTPNITGAVGLGAAIDFLNRLGLDQIEQHERELVRYATARLAEVEGVRLIGTARDKHAVVSFVVDGIHPHDVGSILDNEGIAIRAGHHCAQPVMDRFGVAATSRVSFGVFNTEAEIDALIAGLHKVHEVFA